MEVQNVRKYVQKKKIIIISLGGMKELYSAIMSTQKVCLTGDLYIIHKLKKMRAIINVIELNINTSKIKNKNFQNKNKNEAENGEKLRTARLKSKCTVLIKKERVYAVHTLVSHRQLLKHGQS